MKNRTTDAPSAPEVFDTGAVMAIFWPDCRATGAVIDLGVAVVAAEDVAGEAPEPVAEGLVHPRRLSSRRRYGVRSSGSQDHGSLSRSCSAAPRCRSATPPPNRPLRPPARPTIQIFPTWRQAYPVRPPSTPGGAKGSQRWRHSRGRIRAAAMAPATSPSEISRIRASVSRTCAITQRNHPRELLAERIQTLYPLIRACGTAVGTPVIVWSRRRAGPEWPQAGSARTSRTSPRPRPRGR